ncbi:MAG TPA: hypothetical protein VGJ20_07230 [Xanthobacteraceae bacterium]|jgi:hypothetical protein
MHDKHTGGDGVTGLVIRNPTKFAGVSGKAARHATPPLISGNAQLRTKNVPRRYEGVNGLEDSSLAEDESQMLGSYRARLNG